MVGHRWQKENKEKDNDMKNELQKETIISLTFIPSCSYFTIQINLEQININTEISFFIQLEFF